MDTETQAALARIEALTGVVQLADVTRRAANALADIAQTSSDPGSTQRAREALDDIKDALGIDDA